MKKTIFITVRTGSSRLPQKALLEINGKKTIQFVIERAKKTEADLIVLCTTTLKEDEVLCNIAKQNGIKYFQGSVEDKLIRWKDAANKFNVDFFVEMDGDDLFLEPDLVNDAFSLYCDDYFGDSRNLDCGLDFLQCSDSLIVGCFDCLIKKSALDKVCEIKDTNDTEMIWPYFLETNLFKTKIYDTGGGYDSWHNQQIRMTLDYKEDLEFFTTVDKYFQNQNKTEYNLDDIVSLCEQHPEIPQINWFRTKEWKENQIKKTKLLIK